MIIQLLFSLNINNFIVTKKRFLAIILDHDNLILLNFEVGKEILIKSVGD